jgi:hypothetical protein
MSKRVQNKSKVTHCESPKEQIMSVTLTREQLIDRHSNIDGIEYYTIETMADITYRSEQAIRLLCNKGNRIDKLRYIKFGVAVLIPISELIRFPFASAGRSKLVMRYNADGSEYSEMIA